jgi:hypothetical protein
VTVELAPSGSGTLLRLTHERLPPAQVEPHRRGWASIIEYLAATLASDVGEMEGP